jgi:hypothetical protein
LTRYGKQDKQGNQHHCANRSAGLRRSDKRCLRQSNCHGTEHDETGDGSDEDSQHCTELGRCKEYDGERNQRDRDALPIRRKRMLHRHNGLGYDCDSDELEAVDQSAAKSSRQGRDAESESEHE